MLSQKQKLANEPIKHSFGQNQLTLHDQIILESVYVLPNSISGFVWLDIYIL